MDVVLFNFFNPTVEAYKEALEREEELYRMGLKVQEGIDNGKIVMDEKEIEKFSLVRKEIQQKVRYLKILICICNNFLGKKDKEFYDKMVKMIKEISSEWLDSMDDQVKLGDVSRGDYLVEGPSEGDYLDLCNNKKVLIQMIEKWGDNFPWES